MKDTAAPQKGWVRTIPNQPVPSTMATKDRQMLLKLANAVAKTKGGCLHKEWLKQGIGPTEVVISPMLLM